MRSTNKKKSSNKKVAKNKKTVSKKKKNSKKATSYKKSLVMFILLVLSIIAVTFTATYAYLSTNKTQSVQNSVASSCFSTSFVSNSSDLNLVSYPMSDDKGLTQTPYTFTIKNTCDVSTNYQVLLYIFSDYNSALPYDYVKYSIDGSSVNKLMMAPIATPNYPYIGTYPYLVYALDTGSLEGLNSFKTYNLRLWISEEAGNDVMGKNFQAKIVINNAVDLRETIVYKYSEPGSYSVYLSPGTYLLEVWGAQGGAYNSTTNNGGKGGYSYGRLRLTQGKTVYVYVGGKGSGPNTSGGYNGGGTSKSYGGSGGGASDIRIDGTSYYYRVIVAGGGGGSGYSTTTPGGYGGGTEGGQGANGSTTGGYGGSLSSAGSNNTAGSFGQANANTSNGGAGGGGWYGGASGVSSGTDSAGGGGSGYVYTSSYASYYPSGCGLNSSYYLTYANTLKGSQSFSSPTGIREVGHSGNGYVRITKVNNS